MIVKLSLGILVLAVCIVFAWFIFRPSMQLSCSDTKPTIVAFGDSLVSGYGATSGNDFVTLLASTLGVPIQNRGVSGDTTARGLARVKTITDLKPDMVIILFGGNDALQKVSVEETERNLNAMVAAIKAAGSKPILVGVIGGFPTDPYKAMFERVSNEQDVPLVPNILSGIIGNSNLMSDAIHPNDSGYARIAARLAPILTLACTEV